MYKRILMPIDGSDCSDQAMQQGLELARGLDATVTFLYVVEDPLFYARNAVASYDDYFEDLRQTGREVLERARLRAQEMDVRSESKLIETPVSHPVDAIVEAEAAFDLTVIGTHGRRGFNRVMMGSVAEGVLRRSNKPQLLIRCRSVD